jgi:hypothetical protein
MGIALWIGSGIIAFGLGRVIRAARPRRWAGELVAAIIAAFALGAAATAMDFGGWRELDWRAGLFAFLGTFAALGISRLVRTLGRQAPLAHAGTPDRDRRRTSS